mgnify:CR=1 FL=1
MQMNEVSFFKNTETTEMYRTTKKEKIQKKKKEKGKEKKKQKDTKKEKKLRCMERSVEHTSEPLSRCQPVCRLLLEQRKKIIFDQSLHYYSYSIFICFVY